MAHDKLNENASKYPSSILTTIDLIKFPLKCYHLFHDLELWFLFTAVIDIFWNGMVIEGVRITAEGIYIVIATFITVPFSLRKIIISAKNREVENFVGIASQKVKLH
jgi:hypothetical protein